MAEGILSGMRIIEGSAFIAAPLGVTEARLNLYFGYTVIDLDLLVYSADALTIQIGE